MLACFPDCGVDTSRVFALHSKHNFIRNHWCGWFLLPVEYYWIVPSAQESRKGMVPSKSKTPPWFINVTAEEWSGPRLWTILFKLEAALSCILIEILLHENAFIIISTTSSLSPRLSPSPDGSNPPRFLLPFDYHWRHWFAAFCRILLFPWQSHSLFTAISARQIAVKRGRTRLFRRLIAFDKDTFCVPRQDLPGMMKSLKSSYKTWK